MKFKVIKLKVGHVAVSDIQNLKEEEYFLNNDKIFKSRNIWTDGVEDDEGLLHKFDSETLYKIEATEDTFKLDNTLQFKTKLREQFYLRDIKEAFESGVNAEFYVYHEKTYDQRETGRKNYFNECIESLNTITEIEIDSIDIETYLIEILKSANYSGEEEEVGYCLESDNKKDAEWRKMTYGIEGKCNRGLYIHYDKYFFFDDDFKYIGFEKDGKFQKDFKPYIKNGFYKIKKYIYV